MSPSRRVLLRAGREVPLIPRYFDLLVLLIERRHEAVPRSELLDAVWSDVVVSDGALSQAIRIVRRALGDNPRAPVHIRTHSRHGYRFVNESLVEEDDDAPLQAGPPGASDAGATGALPGAPAGSAASGAARATTSAATPPGAGDPGPAGVVEAERAGDPGPAADSASGRPDPFAAALDALLEAPPAPTEPRHPEDDAAREAAETLHALGTSEALRRLELFEEHPRYEFARASLRDARWDVPGAGPVPLLGSAGGLAAFRQLVALRIRRAWRLARRRWMSSVAGAATAGLLAGVAGGLALRFGPGSSATNSVLVALPLVGLVIGGLGAAGVGAGLAAAEASIRSYRRTALVLAGALGGGAIGLIAHLVGAALLRGLFGQDLSPIAGGLEGLALGGATGLGYGLSTPTAEGGMATPQGAARLRAILVTGLVCGLAAALLGASGSYLGAMSLDFMAGSFPGSQVALDPLARLLGEAAPGPRSTISVSAFEGLMFGGGLAFGITRRPR